MRVWHRCVFGWIALLLGSCSLQSKVTLSLSGTATVEASFSLKPAARDAWKGLRDLDPTLPTDPFNPALWKDGLPGQAQISASTAGTTVAFALSDPKKWFPPLTADSASWDFTLDRAALRRLASFSSWADSPALGALLPSRETEVSEKDYRDLLVYLLGPGTSEEAARLLVDASTVQITVEVPRAVNSAEGSLSIAGNTAVYRWPLVRILTLEKPIKLHLTF